MTLPRKNTVRVIDAWARATRPDGAKLLVVGVESAAGIERFRAQAQAAGVGESVAVSGFVPDDDVSALLSAADGLLYVALAEGFGVPLLDAFACETPVLAGDRTSLPEIAGDAAVLVNPESVPALADGMTALLSDVALRDRLRAAGRARLSLFAWDRAAEQVARVFEQVARR
jgi:glycosyltransferase involved in cell wall biosynthesis